VGWPCPEDIQPSGVLPDPSDHVSPSVAPAFAALPSLYFVASDGWYCNEEEANSKLGQGGLDSGLDTSTYIFRPTLSKNHIILIYSLTSNFSECQDSETLAITNRSDKIKFGDVNSVPAIYESWLLTLCEQGDLKASLLGGRGQQVGAVLCPPAQQD
jgi:hypothetical protein